MVGGKLKIYEVFVKDQWNNVYLCGFYKDLDDSIDDINKYIPEYKFKLQKGDIHEYISTFGTAFDTSVYDVASCKNSIKDEDFEEDNESLLLEIRGFILDSELLKDTLDTLSEMKVGV